MRSFKISAKVGNNILQYLPPAVLIVAWAITHYLIWEKNGIIDYADSHLYLNYFEELSRHKLTDLPREIYYAGYGLFVRLILLAGLGKEGVILAQVLISALGALLCYAATLRLSGSRIAAFMATLLFNTWYKLRIWDYSILTESLFIAGTLVTFYLVVNRKTAWSIILAAIATFTVRPAGILLLAAVAVALLVRKKELLTTRNFLIPVGIVVTLLLLALNLMLREFELVETWSSGKIIHNLDSSPDITMQSKLTISIPDDLFIPDYKLPPLLRAAAFATRNPAFFTRLTVSKFYYFVTDTRPYYSLRHNLFSFLFLTALWVLTLRALRRILDREATTFTAVYLGGTVIMACLTILSWEGRFFAPLYPFLFIHSAAGAVALIKRVKDWKSG